MVFSKGRDQLRAIDEVSLVAHEGESVGIVGESGSGKTSLARVLVGLLRPTLGVVQVDGRPVWGADKGLRFDRASRRRVQIVFQDPYSSLNPRQRAWESVAEALQVTRGLSHRRSRSAALDSLAELGISPEQAHAYPASLSGGQRQRISIGRALAPDPDVLVADEPTSALDQSAQAVLLNLLRQVQKDRGLTIILISHDLAVVRYLTSRLYVMRRGNVVETGPTDAVIANPAADYTRELISARPRPGQLLPKPRETHAGASRSAIDGVA